MVVNLSPPEQKKNGPLFDLAMAVGVMKVTGHLSEELSQDVAFIEPSTAYEEVVST